MLEALRRDWALELRPARVPELCVPLGVATNEGSRALPAVESSNFIAVFIS